MALTIISAPERVCEEFSKKFSEEFSLERIFPEVIFPEVIFSDFYFYFLPQIQL
jgi:hypothetical protein